MIIDINAAIKYYHNMLKEDKQAKKLLYSNTNVLKTLRQK